MGFHIVQYTVDITVKNACMHKFTKVIRRSSCRFFRNYRYLLASTAWIWWMFQYVKLLIVMYLIWCDTHPRAHTTWNLCSVTFCYGGVFWWVATLPLSSFGQWWGMVVSIITCLIFCLNARRVCQSWNTCTHINQSRLKNVSVKVQVNLDW